MKPVITLRVKAVAVFMFVASPVLAIPPAPVGPYQSIEDAFMSNGPDYRQVPVQQPLFDPGQPNRARSIERSNYGSGSAGYVPEQNQPRLQWPQPREQKPYNSGYQDYPRGNPR